MNLHETTITLKKWIASCDRIPQIELINQIMEPFLINRFRGESGLADAVAALLIAMKEKSQSLAPYCLTDERRN